MERPSLALYETIYLYYRRLIESSVYKKGDMLPSVRSEALSRGVNPTTVLRAYRRLEEEGYLVTIPKKGIYVSYGGNCERLSYLREELQKLLRVGYSLEEVREALESLGRRSDDPD